MEPAYVTAEDAECILATALRARSGSRAEASIKPTAPRLAEDLERYFRVFATAVWFEKLASRVPLPLDRFVDGRLAPDHGKPRRGEALTEASERARARSSEASARAQARGLRRRRGRPSESPAFDAFVGDLMGCVIEHLGRPLRVSVAGPAEPTPEGVPTGAVVRFAESVRDHLTERLGRIPFGSPELSRELVALLGRLKPNAIRHQVRTRFTLYGRRRRRRKGDRNPQRRLVQPVPES